MGHRGTGKSTGVRALADLLPQITKVKGCVYDATLIDLTSCVRTAPTDCPLIEACPHSAARCPSLTFRSEQTEDRVCGTLDIERALVEGVKAFEPGLLARANAAFFTSTKSICSTITRGRFCLTRRFGAQRR